MHRSFRKRLTDLITQNFKTYAVINKKDHRLIPLKYKIHYKLVRTQPYLKMNPKEDRHSHRRGLIHI